LLVFRCNNTLILSLTSPDKAAAPRKPQQQQQQQHPSRTTSSAAKERQKKNQIKGKDQGGIVAPVLKPAPPPPPIHVGMRHNQDRVVQILGANAHMYAAKQLQQGGWLAGWAAFPATWTRGWMERRQTPPCMHVGRVTSSLTGMSSRGVFHSTFDCDVNFLRAFFGQAKTGKPAPCGYCWLEGGIFFYEDVGTGYRRVIRPRQLGT
jgi:hypothetical protein